MLNINLIRENPDMVRKGLQDRQMDPGPVDRALELDEKRRSIIQEVEELKAERNVVSKEIGRMKDPDERQEKIDAMRVVGEKISELDGRLRDVESDLNQVIAFMPNIPDERTPYGVDEDENVVLKEVGEIPEFSFQPRPHWELGPELGVIDFEQGVKITGSRFYVLNGAGARLQRPLWEHVVRGDGAAFTLPRTDVFEIDHL